MREIKFRGRDEHGEWHYGAFMGVFYDGVVAPIEYANIYVDGMATRVLPNTVGQFTGLKDSEGREIYEGDIVEISPQFSAKQGLKRKFHLPAVVRWDERRARFVVISKEILDSIPDSECVSVIGNVHDNPELLEVEA